MAKSDEDREEEEERQEGGPRRRGVSWTSPRRSRTAWPRDGPSARTCRSRRTREWEAPADRPDPVGVLEEQNATRVPDLVPIRHGRMIVSPFTFYRGGAGDHGVGSLADPDDGAARAVLR